MEHLIPQPIDDSSTEVTICCCDCINKRLEPIKKKIIESIKKIIEKIKWAYSKIIKPEVTPKKRD
jgi:hypothetical protein